MKIKLPRLPLPLIIFIILIASSAVTSYAIIYSTITSHLANSEEFRLETRYLRVNFPRNWYAMKWEEQNGTQGNVDWVMTRPVDLGVIAFFRVFDETATNTYMHENGFDGTDMLPIITLEMNLIYDWSLENNPNAALSTTSNGTITVSDCSAKYMVFRVKGGLKDDTGLYNMTSEIVACIKQQRMFMAIYYGEEDAWNQTYNTFMVELNSIVLG